MGGDRAGRTPQQGAVSATWASTDASTPSAPSPTEAATKGKHGETDHMFAEDWFPVQVKQLDKVGRPDIDPFEAVMERENRQRGLYVSFAFSPDAVTECAAFHKRTGRIINLLTVQEILDEEFVQKM